ncbi:receptor-like protein Cf-9 homolog [Camellia sinensis]|uniref:receptor-like protein Cf-9 homolog n=1 Tax=Camellia sinensis TaxID=4442 RepID=UPI001035E717|nr:receptor-like protein Cf-9 homolog [Camellia sinensis]
MSWNETTTDCCLWDGIKCDRMTGQVIELDLSWSQLYGTIPLNSSLFSLSHLQRLNLAFNDFTQSRISPSFGQFSSLTHLNLSSSFSGSFPSEISHLSKLVSLDLFSYYQLVKLEPYNFHVLLQNLTQLQYLCLARVNISSVVPISLMNLSSLTHLDLYQSGLQGKLSDEIFHLPLEELYLGYNPNLTGELPDSVGYLKSLKSLYLTYCNLSGSIPMSLGNLTQMAYLALSGNNFEGQIPNYFANFTQMTDLYLSQNNFSGQVTSIFSNLEQLCFLYISYNCLEGQIPNIANLSKIVYFNMRGNNFKGQFPCWIANLTQLVYLDIGVNELTGPFPANLRGLSNSRYFYSDYNYHSGTLPSWLFNLPSLTYLSLAANEFTGQIYEFSNKSMIYIDLRHNKLHGPIPSHPMMVDLLLSNNTFTGEIPSMICNVSSLEILALSHNSLSGVIPQCLANFSNVLSVLDLRMNNFHGNIPSTFAEGNKLRNIDLNGNQLEGSVPRSLATCRHLEVLDLGNNKINDAFPYWLETLQELQVLVFQSNKFHGPVDSSKTKLPFPKLRIFDLSHNEFSGPLPTTYFEHFNAMKMVDEKAKRRYMGQSYYSDSVTIMIKGSEIELQGILTIFMTIDLSHNKFKGEIPNVVGNLGGLRLLNLSHNDLVGNIPSSLGNLRLLESLDLSSNQLSGNIPRQLTSLTFLEVINFSQNRLEGRIPRGHQFETFDNCSYDGNLALCGFPLSKGCGDSKTPQLHSTPMLHKEDDPAFASEFNWKVVGMGYGCGMVLGLVMGYLMFLTGKPKWFVRIADGERYNKGRRSHKSGNRHGGRRK